MTFAATTTVTVEKSKSELDKLLGQHGASQRGIMSDDAAGEAHVVFQVKGRKYRIDVPLPAYKSFGRDKHNWIVPKAKQDKAYEQACRSRWRAVVLIVKAKLEFIALGVSTVEKEFMADLVLPSGERLETAIGRQIESALAGVNPLQLEAKP